VRDAANFLRLLFSLGFLLFVAIRLIAYNFLSIDHYLWFLSHF
jgi:hypothetical protein